MSGLAYRGDYRCQCLTKHGLACESDAQLLYDVEGEPMRLCKAHHRKLRLDGKNVQPIALPSGAVMGKKNRLNLIGAAARRLKMRSC